jgi:circadian clock protein KaiC
MGHSNQIREFLLTDHGIELVDVYLGANGVLMGTARRAQEAEEKAAANMREAEVKRQQLLLESKHKQLEVRIAELRAQFEAECQELERSIEVAKAREQASAGERAAMARVRGADGGKPDDKKDGQREV